MINKIDFSDNTINDNSQDKIEAQCSKAQKNAIESR
jgi:hypothetical protein